MVGESWDVFTKRESLLVEKHINGIKYESPGGTAHLPPFLPMLIKKKNL